MGSFVRINANMWKLPFVEIAKLWKLGQSLTNNSLYFSFNGTVVIILPSSLPPKYEKELRGCAKPLMG